MVSFEQSNNRTDENVPNETEVKDSTQDRSRFSEIRSSHWRILKCQFRPTPFLAILEADLESLIKSKVTIVWLILAFFIGTIAIISSNTIEARQGISFTLSFFIYLWTFVIIGLSAGAVSSEAGVVADSILSRSVKRWEYILAKLTSRCMVVLTVYFVVTVVLSLAALRVHPIGSMRFSGWLEAILMVGLALTLLTIMGVMFSTITSSTVVSVILVMITWYAMIAALPVAGLDALSPAYLQGKVDYIMTGGWNDTLWQMAGGFTALCVIFVITSILYFETKDLGNE